ncbi:uncharacterized protein LOC143276530 [Babylonia areolata]|uniref:uncharacterized protein LOC143276530 n=1 Tax=Babylonia areolata TaxID=304850 RepID=UPI003FD4E490
MAEEKILQIDGDTVMGTEKSKVDPELDRSRGDSDEVSGGSLSEGDDIGHCRGSDNDQRQRKGRRQRRLKGGKKHNRKHHPYAGTSYADRMAMKIGAASEYPHAPRNTTQYLIEDHVKSNISPDLSNKTSPVSVTGDDDATEECQLMNEETEPKEEEKAEAEEDSPHLPLPFTASERLQYDQEFIAVYDHVNEDRLYNMSKEELIRMTSRLLQKVEGGMRTPASSKEQTEKLSESPNTTPMAQIIEDLEDLEWLPEKQRKTVYE